LFNTVIVTADLAAGSDRAVHFARTLASRGRLPLELLTVIPPESDRAHAERRGEALAQAVSGRLTVAVADDVATAILEHARGRDGALLVMGTGGAGLVSEIRHSITGDLLASIPQPVLLVGPAVPQGVLLAAPTLVAGIDRTHLDPAQSVIESWQRTFGGQPPRVVDIVAITGWPVDAMDPSAERDGVAAVVEALAAQGIEAVAEVLHGADPVTSLLEFADELTDPVFLTTSDRWAGGPSHWYSTTRRLVQRSTRPVLIVPSDLAG
jgi:nucleotide-binding universal stress UspA family protein